MIPDEASASVNVTSYPKSSVVRSNVNVLQPVVGGSVGDNIVGELFEGAGVGDVVGELFEGAGVGDVVVGSGSCAIMLPSNSISSRYILSLG